jgi:hypothetical protein
MLKYVVILGLVGVASIRSGSAQESTCPTDAQRRQAAVRFARDVNTAEARFHSLHARYGQVSELALVEPDGFHAQLSSDATAYNFSLKDTVDACHFALFSDQQGLIYAGQPLR